MRGICFALSNRELNLLEPLLTYRKETNAPRSNRELSTIQRYINFDSYDFPNTPSAELKTDALSQSGCATSTRSGRKVEVAENKRLNPFYSG
jgi:hypothetical protein